MDTLISPHAYTQDMYFKNEKSSIFNQEPLYLGHAKMLPSPGSYVVSDRHDKKFIFIRDQTQINCLINSCQHRHAQMLDDIGVISSISCPFHYWKYDLNGQLLNAPHFHQTPCVSLLSTKTCLTQ